MGEYGIGECSSWDLVSNKGLDDEAAQKLSRGCFAISGILAAYPLIIILWRIFSARHDATLATLSTSAVPIPRVLL